MLTDTKCRNAKPKEKPYRLADTNGLFLEVKPNGMKAWRFRFKLRANGETKESIFAIGDYAIAPSGETKEEALARRAGRQFTLAEAREERLRARALVKQGVNPAHHRQQEKMKRQLEAADTLEVVTSEWLALRQWEHVTKERRLAMLKRVVFPTIGKLPIREITSPSILRILKKAAENNGPSVAAEAKRTLYGIFEFASETFRVNANPVHKWREALPKNKTQHKRPLTTEEIGQIMRDLEKHGGRHETVVAFQLMWWTLCRPSEAVEAEWSEFDLEHSRWTIGAERMKMRKKHVIPLPSQAVEALRALRLISGGRTHVFPGRDDRTKSMSTASFRQMLHALGWSGRYSPHATRTTGSTRLHELGYSPDWIERQLAHAEPNRVRATYNHAEHLADRARMMQHWADLLDLWRAGDGSKDVPIGSAGS